MGVVHLLLNPAASGDRRARQNAEIKRAVEIRGHEVTELRPLSVDAIVPTLQQADAAGMTRLIIAGGDGLLHQTLPAIARTDVTVGIVALGTGNDFARALGLPDDIEGAVATALADPAPVDLISAGDDRWAASVITGGFSGRVNGRANSLRFPPGQHRYTAATLLELPRLATTEIQLDVDGTIRTFRSTLFAIANSRYFGGGMAICPDASPADGLLDVTVIGPTSRHLLARLLPTVFSGRHVDHPAVATLRGQRISITTDADIWADGERFATRPPDGNLDSDPTKPATRGGSYIAVPNALQLAGSLVRA